MNPVQIPYGRQDISEEDIDAVISVLRSDFLTQGPSIQRFEKLLSEYCGVDYAVAVNSATSALHIACMALGVGSGDLVWTTPNTFVASANAALYCGAKVEFIDISPKTYNLNVDFLEEKLENAKKIKALPKVVIPVHFAGQPCDMQEIYRLSKLYGFSIIEDASHAIGAEYLDGKIGNCCYSDICVFSFHPVKIITTGEGGGAVTKSEYLYKKMALLRSHGITRDIAHTSHASDPWYYEQIDLGFNYRMTDMQAALGVSQMTRLEKYISERRDLARIYDAELSSLPIKLPYQAPNRLSAYHLYPIWLDENSSGISRKLFFKKMREDGVGVNVHYIPVYLQPYYRALGFKSGQCPVAEKYYSGAVSIPLYPELGNSIDRVVTLIKKNLNV